MVYLVFFILLEHAGFYADAYTRDYTSWE